MNYSWLFKKATPGDRARESQVEKFFNSDAVKNRADAIVREGIQNSLDATLPDQVLRVHVKLGQWSAAEKAQRLPRYTRGFDEHFEDVRSKLLDPPSDSDAFRYLVFEDFGTSGLTGNAAQWWPDEHGEPNPFLNYFRAEGVSDKHDGARGRHGVGRLVFMFASRVRSILGLTRRNDGGDLLVDHRGGQAIERSKADCRSFHCQVKRMLGWIAPTTRTASLAFSIAIPTRSLANSSGELAPMARRSRRLRPMRGTNKSAS